MTYFGQLDQNVPTTGTTLPLLRATTLPPCQVPPAPDPLHAAVLAPTYERSYWFSALAYECVWPMLTCLALLIRIRGVSPLAIPVPGLTNLCMAARHAC